MLHLRWSCIILKQKKMASGPVILVLIIHLLYHNFEVLYFFLAVFERVTKKSVHGIWSRRSKLNLVGAHINVFTGEWTQKVWFCPFSGSFKETASILSLIF